MSHRLPRLVNSAPEPYGTAPVPGEWPGPALDGCGLPLGPVIPF